MAFTYQPASPAGLRPVIANFSLSLDGKVSGKNGEYDMSWIVPHAITPTAREHMIAITSPATTALLGRKNYQGFGSYWPGVAQDETADPHDRAFSSWLNTVEKIVFSSTLTEASWQNSRVVNADPAAVVAGLKKQAGGPIIVLASTSLIQQLLRAGLVDRLGITLCPEIAGGGRSLFDDGLPSSGWVLTHSTPTESGALCLVYDRARQP